MGRWPSVPSVGRNSFWLRVELVLEEKGELSDKFGLDLTDRDVPVDKGMFIKGVHVEILPGRAAEVGGPRSGPAVGPAARAAVAGRGLWRGPGLAVAWVPGVRGSVCGAAVAVRGLWPGGPAWRWPGCPVAAGRSAVPAGGPARPEGGRAARLLCAARWAA